MGEDIRHREYLARREELSAIRTDSINSFDKAILSLSTGSLALSIAFIDKIGKPFNGATYLLLFVTWVCLFLVILSNLLSFLFAKRNMDKRLAELDRKYKHSIEHPDEDNPFDENRCFWERTATERCNIAGYVMFVIGILALTVYVALTQHNAYSETQEKEKMGIKKTAGVTETSAAVPQPNGILMEKGATQIPQTIQQGNGTGTRPGGRIITHGATEIPQAVAQPSISQAPSPPPPTQPQSQPQTKPSGPQQAPAQPVK